ncbi:hypothetical protein N7532_008645 [Penicillium argentinense]|uniref:C2H2-type domain-containing protein n=1 Tax=Penicillium argentinense TaxID=1131581 RepID=A0A9W9EY04_9EURO|nr:uncharacterized protein N7532_008645 [Penicillium argentinense]KAJ5089961.1 hypothetical protein N7532_008645 [Penicillium argentinense]
MSFGDSRSQQFSFDRRDPDDQPKVPASQSDIGFPSTPIESVQAPGFQQGAFSIQSSAWPFNSHGPALESHSRPIEVFSTSLDPQGSSTSLKSSSSLPSSALDSDTPLSGQSGQPSFDGVDQKEQLTDYQTHGLEITSLPMSVASESYFAGPMQPNSQHYMWANRPFQPLQSPPGNMNQQYPPSQPYATTGYPVGYSSQPSGALPSYQQELPTPSSYLPVAPGSAQRQNPSRSPPIPRSFPSHSAATMPDPPLMPSSPPYIMSQQQYYLPEAQPIPSSHNSSISSQTSSMMHDSIYSASEPATAQPDTAQELHVMSSRPRPQCWDHGCNGREFSTFSNLLRHQREKSGVVAKAECPVCGAVFTRTTARNIHVAQGKCKGAGGESSGE